MFRTRPRKCKSERRESAQFTKTTKHKEGDGMFEKVFTGEGMEMHMTRQGDIVYLPEESFGDRGVILQAWKVAQMPPLIIETCL